MIVTAVDRRKNKTRQNCLVWVCSDGFERTTTELAEVVGMSSSTLISRWHIYGVHWLITHKGKIDQVRHNKYKLKDHKQYHKDVTPSPGGGYKHVLKTRSGKIIPDCGKYDDLIPCPPAATGPYVKDESFPVRSQPTDKESVLSALRKLKKFNTEMVEKGFLDEPGTLTNPRFPSGWQGKHIPGIPCNI